MSVQESLHFSAKECQDLVAVVMHFSAGECQWQAAGSAVCPVCHQEEGVKMREALDKWLKKQNIEMSIDAAHSLCSSLELDGEKVDECLGLCYQLEKGSINRADFINGLSLLTGKKPEEVAEMLKRRLSGNG